MELKTVGAGRDVKGSRERHERGFNLLQEADSVNLPEKQGKKHGNA